MAISEAFSGTNSSWGTEYSLSNSSTTLANQTDDGVYQLFLDLFNMASGDTYVVKVYEKVRSADTRRVVLSHTLVGAQTDPNWCFPALTLMHGFDFSLVCTAGTNTRAITWSIRKIA